MRTLKIEHVRTVLAGENDYLVTTDGSLDEVRMALNSHGELIEALGKAAERDYARGNTAAGDEIADLIIRVTGNQA